MGDLIQFSLVAGGESSLNRLNVPHQFLDQEIPDAEADLAFKIVGLHLDAGARTTAELIRNQPDKYTVAGPSRFTFTLGFQGQLKALTESLRSAQHILQAA